MRLNERTPRRRTLPTGRNALGPQNARSSIKYNRAGRAYIESSRSTRKEDARRKLAEREGDIARGKPITSKVGRLTFDDAAKDLLTDYRTNGKRSLAVVERRVTKHLTPFFTGRRMAEITTPLVRTYIEKRQTDLTVRRLHEVKQSDGTTTWHVAHHPASNAEIFAS